VASCIGWCVEQSWPSTPGPTLCHASQDGQGQVPTHLSLPGSRSPKKPGAPPNRAARSQGTTEGGGQADYADWGWLRPDWRGTVQILHKVAVL
jgi:hypothetical protein